MVRAMPACCKVRGGTKRRTHGGSALRAEGQRPHLAGVEGELGLAISDIFDYKFVITNQGCADVHSYKSRVSPNRP